MINKHAQYDFDHPSSEYLKESILKINEKTANINKLLYMVLIQ